MKNNESRITLQNIDALPEHAYPVFVVDDLSANRLLLKKLLAKEGYASIHLFSSATPMLEALNRTDELPGLILLDIMMPDINGIEVLQYLKTNEQYRDIPVIMVTAHQEDQYLSKAFEVGAVDYIRKPINRTELLARVHAALRLKHLWASTGGRVPAKSGIRFKSNCASACRPGRPVRRRRICINFTQYGNSRR